MKRKSVDKQIASTQGSSAQPESALARLLPRLSPPPVNAQALEQQSPVVVAEQVERLAFCGLDPAAIALLLGCSQTRLSNEFAEALGHGRARQKQFLLEKLTERIDNGEWLPLKFALKNVCGMADNPEQAALQRQKLAREQDAASSAGGQGVRPSSQPAVTADTATRAELPVPEVPTPLPPTRTAATTKTATNHAQAGGHDA